MKPIVSIVSLLWTTCCSAQIIALGAQSIALNQQKTLVAEQAGTLFLNPSMLLETPRLSAWLSHYRPFAIADLSVYALAGGYRSESFGIGAGAIDFGNALYRDQTFCMAAAFSVASTFKLGARYKMRAVSISGYGSVRSNAIDIGFHLPVTEHILIGALINNVVAGKFVDTPQPREVLTAMRIDLDAGLQLFAEIAQAQHFEAENRFGIAYRPLSNFSVRLGTGINTPAAFSGGFGVHVSLFHISYALQNHPELSQSHIFSIAIARAK